MAAALCDPVVALDDDQGSLGSMQFEDDVWDEANDAGEAAIARVFQCRPVDSWCQLGQRKAAPVCPWAPSAMRCIRRLLPWRRATLSPLLHRFRSLFAADDDNELGAPRAIGPSPSAPGVPTLAAAASYTIDDDDTVGCKLDEVRRPLAAAQDCACASQPRRMR